MHKRRAWRRQRRRRRRFGSFTYLRTLAVGYIKIDLSFVRRLLGSGDEGRFFQSILGITEQFDLATIVEGVEDVEDVEDQATLDLLRELGADYAQRFHVGRPVPLSRAHSSM